MTRNPSRPCRCGGLSARSHRPLPGSQAHGYVFGGLTRHPGTHSGGDHNR